jgi:hypothetical protein
MPIAGLDPVMTPDRDGAFAPIHEVFIFFTTTGPNPAGQMNLRADNF